MTKIKINSLLAAACIGGFFLNFQQAAARQLNIGKRDSVVSKLPKNLLTGVVVEGATKKPLVGIRIAVAGFSAAITDEKGSFSLSVPSFFTEVSITGEGFGTKQVALKGSQSLKIALNTEAPGSFQEEVVLPFGRLEKRKTTAAVSGYNSNAEWTRPFETTDALLQSKISGLNVIRRSGTPGAGANLFLRGFNSLYGSNAPLIVVDGIIFDANDYGKSLIANNYTNPLALINPLDIDNYTVIKDASSIYGTKGANGAIIITTATAKQEATNIDFGVYTSANQAPEALPVMNSSQYRSYLGEMLQSKGASAAELSALPFMRDDTLGNRDYYRYHNNTNWQKNVLRNSMNQNYYLKVTGGDNIATYALSVGYTKNGGTISNTDLSRYNTRFNAAFNFSKKITGIASLAFAYNQNNLKYQGVVDKTAPLYGALIKAPFLTPYEVNEKGISSPNLEDTDILGISNPNALTDKMQAYNRYYRFIGSYKFNYQFSKALTISTQIGVVYDKVRENIFIPRKGVADDTLSNAIADSRLGTQVKRLFTVYNDSRLEFKRTFNSYHSIFSSAGVRLQNNKTEQDFVLGYNSATDELISVQNGVPALRQTGGAINDWNWLNTYFNFDYGFKNKLFVSLNAAVDGSSRFGSRSANGININGFQFALMPSLAGAWLVSSEKFMAGSKIDLLKLRLSYGLTGNDDIGNYTHRQTYTSQNLLGMQGLVRSGIANPGIQWETNAKLNAGADIALWNERINLTIDLYRNRTYNMLVYDDLPAAVGIAQVLTNSGSMQNSGIELGVNSRVLNYGKLKLDLGFNVAANKNKILSLPEGSILTNYGGATLLTQQNNQAARFFGYVAQGVFSTEAEAAAAGLKMKNTNGTFSAFKAGDIRFKDINNDKIIDANDRTVIGSSMPKLIGGFNSHLEYGRFSFDAIFGFSYGGDVFNYLKSKMESASGVENQFTSVVNRWRAEGQKTEMPKAAYGDPMGNNRFSSRWIEDGAYFRLRNTSLSYAIPFKEKNIKTATIYLSGTNLFTLTRYSGYDPEFSATPGVFGQGIDLGLDPLYKSIIIGAKFGL